MTEPASPPAALPDAASRDEPSEAAVAPTAAEPIRFVSIVCPLCRTDAATTQAEVGDVLHGLPGTFRLVRCTACGHVFMNPQPTANSLAACYPDEYGCHTDAAEPVDLPPSGRTDDTTLAVPRSVRILKWVPGLRSLYRWLAEKQSDVVPSLGRTLELGCGRGDFLTRLRDAGHEVVGVDLVPRSVELCRRRGFDTRLGTLPEQDLPPQSVDAICGWMVLEHTPDPREVIAAAARAIRPGGTLALSVPDYGSLLRRLLGPYWLDLDPPRHLQHFTPRTLRALLAEEGFAVETLRHQRSAFGLVGSIGLWLRSGRSTRRFGDRVIGFVDSPSMRGELALAPLAKLLGWTRQSGRMTAVARRLPAANDASADRR